MTTATNYHLQISVTSDFLSIIHEDSLLIDTSKQIIGLLYNTTYYWRVRAKSITSTSNWSILFSFSTLKQPSRHIILFGGLIGLLYSPDKLEAIIGDTIQWQGDFILHPLSSTTIPTGASSWHVVSGTSFGYTVVNSGTYNYICDFHFVSGMVGSFVAVDYSPLNAPNLIFPSNASSGAVINPTILWRSINNATKYHLQISTTPDFLNIVKEDTSFTDTSKQITGLVNNISHYWRVRGRNILTVSNWSSVWSFKTILIM